MNMKYIIYFYKINYSNMTIEVVEFLISNLKFVKNGWYPSINNYSLFLFRLKIK